MKYITFTREMARAIAEGRKTMTRRVVKWPGWIKKEDGLSIEKIVRIINRSDSRGVVKRGCCDGITNKYICPYGAPGDKTTIGTTWAVPKEYDHMKPTELPVGEISFWSYFCIDENADGFGKLRPARFLPSRLRHNMPTVTLKDVHIERVQDIKRDEIYKEGAITDEWLEWREDAECVGLPPGSSIENERDVFEQLWDQINAKRGYSWESNPWVWVLEW